jgi:hypothetical protein
MHTGNGADVRRRCIVIHSFGTQDTSLGSKVDGAGCCYEQRDSAWYCNFLRLTREDVLRHVRVQTRPHSPKSVLAGSEGVESSPAARTTHLGASVPAAAFTALAAPLTAYSSVHGEAKGS